MCIRILIADDQPRSRRSLKALLTAMSLRASGQAGLPAHAGFLPVQIVGEAEDGQATLEQVQALHPDVVVMDLHAHSLSAPETIQMIKSRWPAIRIVVLTMYATERSSVLAAGADAFLLKGCLTHELLTAVMPGLDHLSG